MLFNICREANVSNGFMIQITESNRKQIVAENQLGYTDTKSFI